MSEGSRREFDEWAPVRQTAATQEGLDAFAEKRRPDFQGVRRRDGPRSIVSGGDALVAQLELLHALARVFGSASTTRT